MVVRPRCRARVGCCQSNGAGYPKGCPAPLVFGIAARTTAVGMHEQGSFGKAPYLLCKAEALLRSTLIVHSWAGAASPNSLLPV